MNILIELVNGGIYRSYITGNIYQVHLTINLSKSLVGSVYSTVIRVNPYSMYQTGEKCDVYTDCLQKVNQSR
jgi:hypothetical protein